MCYERGLRWNIVKTAKDGIVLPTHHCLTFKIKDASEAISFTPWAEDYSFWSSWELYSFIMLRRSGHLWSMIVSQEAASSTTIGLIEDEPASEGWTLGWPKDSGLTTSGDCSKTRKERDRSRPYFFDWAHTSRIGIRECLCCCVRVSFQTRAV